MHLKSGYLTILFINYNIDTFITPSPVRGPRFNTLHWSCQFCIVLYVGLIPAFAKTSTGQSDIVRTLS